MNINKYWMITHAETSLFSWKFPSWKFRVLEWKDSSQRGWTCFKYTRQFESIMETNIFRVLFETSSKPVQYRFARRVVILFRTESPKRTFFLKYTRVGHHKQIELQVTWTVQ